MAGSWTASLCFFDGRAPLPARFRIRYLLLATASTAYCSLGLEAQAMGCEAVRCSASMPYVQDLSPSESDGTVIERV